jgi:predicted nucleic acid-binding Zn ribbon protein
VHAPEPPGEGRPRRGRGRREVERWLKTCPACGRGFVGAPQRTTCSDACRMAQHRQRVGEVWRGWAMEALAICRRCLESLETGRVDPAALAALRARAQSLHPSSLRRRALLTIERVERYGVGALEGDLNRSASHRLRAWQPPP